MTARTHDFVLKYDGKEKSYFKGWTSPARLPMFGATLKDTPRFATEAEARAELNGMPFQASAMVDIKAVKHRPPRKSA